MRKGLLVAALLALNGCDALSPRNELQRARARWAANRPQSYEITLTRGCECTAAGVGPVSVAVFDQTVVGREYTSNGAAVSPSVAPLFPTVDGLFLMIEGALERRVAKIRVAYHPTLGYPTSVYIDEVSPVVDDEVQTTVTKFTEVIID